MSDIAPKLLENLQKSYESNLAADKKAAASLEKINAGNGNYVTAGEYAECVGSSLAKSFQTNLSSNDLPDGKMYWNIAEKTIEPLMKEEYNTVSKVAQTVQKSLNTKAGMGLNAVKASYDYDLVKGIMDKVCSYDSYDDAAWLLNDAAVSFSRAVVDQTLKANINFQGKSGKTPKIIRRSGFKCCQWCADLEGIYEYPKVPEDVYRRHDNCRCDVEYDPGNGKVQNVHTKEWRDADERDRIEERKRFGQETRVDKEQLKSVNSSLGENPYNNIRRNIDELRTVAEQMKTEVGNYTSRKSLWSGKINIDNSMSSNGVLGRKEWNCDITLVSTADDSVVLHEMLHSCSVSYYRENPEIFAKNQKIEEGTVQLLTEQICLDKGIAFNATYTNEVNALKDINEKINFGTDLEFDLEFAKEIFDIPLEERYNKLYDKAIQEMFTKNASIGDVLEIEDTLKKLEG